jgi:hypothetical protein
MGEAKRRRIAALNLPTGSLSNERSERMFKLTSNPITRMQVETNDEPENLEHLMENLTGIAPYINVEGTFTGEQASLEDWVCSMNYGYAINFEGDRYIISRMLDSENPTDMTTIEHLLKVLRERVDRDFALDGKAPPTRTGSVKLIPQTPTTKDKILAYAATATNNQMWDMIVEAARLLKQSVTLAVEFDEDSEYPGRQMELSYDPITDKQSWKWLDE